MNKKLFATFATGLVTGCLLGALVGCGSMQQNVKTVKATVKLAEDACVFIKEVAPDSKEGAEICAKEEELRPFIKLILGARAKASDAGKD